MTSYQKRKAEIRRLKELQSLENKEFITMKHILLSIARGQKEHAKTMLAHFEKSKVNHNIFASVCDKEIEEIKSLIERM